ncbi:MAG: crotonase/enoyl-CoA hydratase family protein [Deltaproteobacteria bacterium]|nr:crotonase/enoyl-CoA hydratase family protein [Deltaproteobacteria bacterium]
MSFVRSESQGPVLVVTIDRPEVRNAIDGPTATELAEVFRDFDSDEERRVAVLTGADRCFCAGADLKAVSQGRGNPVRIDGDGPLGPSRMQLSKPVIAAVEGHAVAGGLELALWCDLRVAARDAVFGVYCRRWGVPLIDGGTVRLPRLIGQSHAMDMVLTGRAVSGEEALRMGLANRLAEPGQSLPVAVDLAGELARFPQGCMGGDRRSLLEQWGLSHEAAMRNEFRIGVETLRSGETLEGATRFAAGAGRHGSFDDL